MRTPFANKKLVLAGSFAALVLGVGATTAIRRNKQRIPRGGNQSPARSRHRIIRLGSHRRYSV